MLYVLHECKHAERAQEAYNLRTFIREAFPDVRTRADIIKKLWEFITEVSEAYESDIDWVVPEPTKKGTKRKKTDEGKGRTKKKK